MSLRQAQAERRFGDAAARLCGLAAAVLGWRPGEFWEATPAELASSLILCGDAAEGPDMATIEELKRRFPDHPSSRT